MLSHRFREKKVCFLSVVAETELVALNSHTTQDADDDHDDGAQDNEEF